MSSPEIEAPGKRRTVQMAPFPAGSRHLSGALAVADDGSAWCLGFESKGIGTGTWSRLPPLPDPECVRANFGDTLVQQAPGSRRIVQVAAFPAGFGHSSGVLAVADDGSAWVSGFDSKGEGFGPWSQMPELPAPGFTQTNLGETPNPGAHISLKVVQLEAFQIGDGYSSGALAVGADGTTWVSEFDSEVLSFGSWSRLPDLPAPGSLRDVPAVTMSTDRALAHSKKLPLREIAMGGVAAVLAGVWMYLKEREVRASPTGHATDELVSSLAGTYLGLTFMAAGGVALIITGLFALDRRKAARQDSALEHL